MGQPQSAYAEQLVHLQAAWRSDRTFGVEWLVTLVLCASAFLMPVTLVREVAGRSGVKCQRLAVEIYTFLKPAVLALLLWSASYRAAPWIAPACLVELYVYLLGVLLLSALYGPPASAHRSFILLAPNSAEHVLGFSLLYLTWGSIGSAGVATHDPYAIVFFSVVTSATVGFGDLVPLDRATRHLVVAQIAASVLFLSVLLTTATSSLGQRHDRAA